MKTKSIIAALLLAASSTFGQVSFQSISQNSLGLPNNNYARAIIDYNNDDLEDIIASDSAFDFKLYKNNGNSTFSSVNVAVYQKLNDSQLNALINVADFNNDGFQDFVIVYRDSIKFYKNNGGLTFIDMTNTLGINNPITNRTLAYNNNEGSGDVPSGGAWDDYDADGDLDYIIGTKDASNSYIEVFVNNVTSFNTRNIILTFPLLRSSQTT